MNPPRPDGRGLLRRRIISLPIIALLLFPIVGLHGAHAESIQRYREVRYVMGTLLDITLYHHDGREARRTLNKAFSLAERLDGLLSNYKPQSEVSRLNQKGGQGRVPVSPEFYELLLKAKELGLKTQGAFDITIGSLLALWRSAGTRDELPTPRSLENALRLVGMNQVVLHPEREVELRQKGVRIDTGGIGKGYAVDLIARLFRRSGIEAGLINFGQSSVYAMGSPPGSPSWALLLRFQDREPEGVVKLKDQAFSASDSLGRSFMIRGKEYGHLIDPRNGTPVTERIRAVVLAPSATEAEALSKYVILRGCINKGQVAAWSRVLVMRMDASGPSSCSEDFPLLPMPMVNK